MGIVRPARCTLYAAYWRLLDSPALAVLVELDAKGVQFRLFDGVVRFRRHHGSLTDAHRRVLADNVDAVKALVVMLCDTGLISRRRRFELMFAQAAPGTLPTNVFQIGIPYAAGICFSCGHTLPKPEFGRCWRCALAWRIAWRSLPAPIVSAADEARIA